jgi:hypothetical protein
MRLSADEKKDFMKKVTILIDSREQVNEHITQVLSQLGVMFATKKLDYGDYSFTAEGKDFSHSCVIERKAKIDELYGNVTGDRERIEKELDTISRNAVQCTLLLEGCKSWEHLKEFQISEAGAEKQGRKVRNIGATVYSALQAWRCGNRYRFDVEFVMERKNTALKMLELFYYFWHNYKQQTAPRK